MVGDKGLMKKTIVWFEGTSDAGNITKRTLSARYQGDGLAPLQQTLRKIFITLWTEDDSVRERTLGFLNYLEEKENHLEEEEIELNGWMAAKARKLRSELCAQMPFRVGL